MNIFLKLIVISLVLVAATAHADGKIIKWVDKNGVTQYGDRPPMPNKASKTSVLNNQGVTIETRDTSKSHPEQDKALAEQARYDRALLASYNSIEEIEISQQRNTRIDRTALEMLEKKHLKLSEALAENNSILLDHAKKGRPAPATTAAAIEKDTAAIKKLEEAIADKKATIEKINERYESDKLRYTVLESRKGELNSIKYKNKTLADLRRWKNAAERRINKYETEAIQYRRAGQPIPKRVATGILSATNERDRALAEINAAEEAIQNSKRKVSR